LSESSMANSHWKSANRMVDQLVVEHAHDPQSWLLRVSIRLCTAQWLGASQDCRYLLSIDRDNYRACVFLGQCYWFMNRLGIAKECFLEAARIYPDCSVPWLAMPKVSRGG
ncbi:MAG: tetratricopeptide repeat protein, partial [Pirellula sp.]